MEAVDTTAPRPLLDTARHVVQGNFGVPLLLLVIMGMMTLPIPPFLLDVFFSFNIALAIVVLLVAVYAMRPLDFAVFPTVLLVATLLRLALNVASTRVVLLEGHAGGASAGKVIEAFGEVVIGGNYAVGLVVFLILIIINFVVVTKGAGRISEVSARFTLDAMPGKQMAIDADLNAGLIDQDQAKTRREEVSSEADFYGAMDGASKFVRGDAVAGILILVINLIGGLGIGIVQHELEFADAMQKYSLLTIGDGLVAQIPSLLLSSAAAIMVTRVNSSEDMGQQVYSQMFASPRALSIAAGILGLMGVIPGMPHIAFLSLAALAGGGAWYITQQSKTVSEVDEVLAEEVKEQPAEPSELGWEDVSPVDRIGLEVGYRLIPLVDKNQQGDLLGRIRGIRKKLSQDIGFLIPPVHIRDNLDLGPNTYRIVLMGVGIAEAEIFPDRELAINPGQVFGELEGVAITDPAFGLDAVWIDTQQKENAQSLGYTVVDASTVVATHLNKLLKHHVNELLGHDEAQRILDMLAETAPKLVEELVPSTVNIQVFLRLLKMLLEERVPIRDMRTIAEAIASNADLAGDMDQLCNAVRMALSRNIIQSIYGDAENLPVITLDPALEQMLQQSVAAARQSGDSNLDSVIEPNLAQQLQINLQDLGRKQEMDGKPAVLLVTAAIRNLMARFARISYGEFYVLAFSEIPTSKNLTIEASIS
ncbi:MAG: flagellar biosynthesis protein FlhA [Pseudomonadota bacterium]